MNIFGVCVLICSIAVGIGHPLNNQPFRYVRQSSAQQLRDNVGRQRLRNYPVAQSPYQTLKIDYPGSISYQGPYAYVTNKPTINSRVGYQQVAQGFPNQADETVQSQPETPISTTTTQLPIIVNQEPAEVEEEVTKAPLPISTIRNSPVRAKIIRRIRPQVQQPVQQFEQDFGQDFADDKSVLPEQAVARAPYVETEEERLLREKQAKSAHYSFGTSIDDKINDHAISRQETREGLALRGMYSYSDGYFKRTIHYEADENGYRVVKEEIEPIGDGPQFNPAGTADVTADLHNNHLSYSITADDFVRERNKKKVVTESPEGEYEEDE